MEADVSLPVFERNLTVTAEDKRTNLTMILNIGNHEQFTVNEISLIADSTGSVSSHNK